MRDRASNAGNLYAELRAISYEAADLNNSVLSELRRRKTTR